MPWFYYVGRFIAWIVLIPFSRLRIKGRENIPMEGPLLIVANHISTSDPPVLALSINRGIIFMAKDTLFRVKWKSYFIRNFGAFPVNRERLDTKVLRHVDKVLDKGLALAMFPEGGRSTDYRLMTPKPGSAVIATRRNIPILPVAITGTEKTQGHWWIFRRPTINVAIGPSFRLPEKQGKLSKEKLAEYSAIIMNRIAEMLPPEYLGDTYAAGKSG